MGVLLLIIPGLVPPIWALVDGLVRPNSQWAAIEQSKPTWAAVLVIGAFLTPVGVAVAIAYFASIRPKLRRAA